MSSMASVGMVLVPPMKCRPPSERWRAAVEFYARPGAVPAV